jgi:hypothetical protein
MLNTIHFETNQTTDKLAAQPLEMPLNLPQKNVVIRHTVGGGCPLKPFAAINISTAH